MQCVGKVNQVSCRLLLIQVLESDHDFRNKLEGADVDKIRDGSIADELDFVHHNVRSQLDDIKRRELERLRHLAMKQYEMNQGIDRQHAKIPNHIDMKMPTFEKEDLKKLIKTTTKDLEEADQKRRDDFKKYEMEKRFEEEQMLAHIEDEGKRAQEKAKLEELKAKHKKHETPHHPMTKDQLEEVWEEQDHMPADEFDPKTFFAMHDLDGNGFWDEDEIKVLFEKELEKVYDPNAPEDDMREKEEEMERMREHVFGEADLDKDKLISFDEFLKETKRDEFETDPGWHTLDEDMQDEYSDDEFRAYEMQRQREIQEMINRGVVPHGYPYLADLPPGAQAFPPHPGMMPPQHPGAAGVHPGMQQPQLGVPGQPAYHPPEGQQQQQQQFGQQQQQFGQQQQQFAQQPVQHQQFAQPVQQQQGQFAQQPQQFAPPVPAGQPQQPQQFGQPVARGPAQPQPLGGGQQQPPHPQAGMQPPQPQAGQHPPQPQGGMQPPQPQAVPQQPPQPQAVPQQQQRGDQQVGGSQQQHNVNVELNNNP